MKIKQFIALSISSIFLLSACGGGDPETTNGDNPLAGMVTYEASDFSLQIPQDWEIIEKNSFTSNVPAETVVAFRNNLKNEVFTTNVNVTITQVTEGQSSNDFAKSSLAQARNSLVAFQEISQNEETIDGNNVLITEFSGKKTALEERINFKQLSYVSGGIGYSVTASYLPNEDQGTIEQINAMLSSFSVI